MRRILQQTARAAVPRRWMTALHTVHSRPPRNNTANFNIIESTLREGEQFANAFFTSQQKQDIAKMLDDFGVEFIELTSPAASPASRRDCAAIAKMNLHLKTLTHVRCCMEDAKIAVETGVDGIDVVFGTSSELRKFSHGKSIEYIIESAKEVITYVKKQGVQVRFSSEDSFRSELVDLLNIYSAADRIGVNRVGIADTVGVADPRQVYALVSLLRSLVDCDIEFHGHNDTGCAIANAYAALEAGATHIDTSILGIGERNGIASLGGFVARMYTRNPEYVKKKYNLKILKKIEDYVGKIVGIQTPFNNYITGFTAFTHKAGIHAKGVLNNPSTYEILRPEDFGMTRYIHVGHRLTGWNAVKHRVQQLGLNLSDEDVKTMTAHIKALAELKPDAMTDIDSIINQWCEQHQKKAKKPEKQKASTTDAAVSSSSTTTFYPPSDTPPSSSAPNKQPDSPLYASISASTAPSPPVQPNQSTKAEMRGLL